MEGFQDSYLTMNRDGESKGFGIVRFDNDVNAAAAIAEFSEQEFDGRPLMVRYDYGKRFFNSNRESSSEEEY